MIQGAAYATTQSDGLLVAMKYKELVPVARWGQFEEKVQEISKKMKVTWGWKMARGKHRRRRRRSTFGTFLEPQVMETDGCNTRYNIGLISGSIKALVGF